MVEINPSLPQQGKSYGAQKPPASPLPTGNQTFEPGKGWQSYKNWLGDAGYKKFQEMLCQNISHQIGQEKAKEQKRKEVMRKSIEGKTDIYD